MKSNKKLAIKDHYYKIIPLALILLIVPCIVYLKAISLSGAALDISRTGDTSYNFFSYYKSVWLYVFTILSVAFCIFYMQAKKIKFKLPIIFIPLLVYYVFVFLSSSFSEYKDVAFGGFTDRNEGFFVITCYVLICFMATMFVTYGNDIKILFGAIMACGFILGIIGISQFWNFDFFQTGFGKSMIISSENANIKDILSFKFPKQYIYSTLFNPNYVGSFFAMLLPMSISFAIFSKKIAHRIVSCIFSLLCFTNLIGSLSTTGYIASAVSIIVLIVFFNKNFFKAWRTILVLFVCFTVLLFWMNNVSNGTILPSLKSSTTRTALAQSTLVQSVQEIDKVQSKAAETKTLQLKTSQASQLKPQTLELQSSYLQTSNLNSTQPKQLELESASTPQEAKVDQNIVRTITDFSIDKNVLKIYINSNLVNIILNTEDGTLNFTDGSGKNVNYVNVASDSSQIVLTDPLFYSIVIKLDGSVLSVTSSNSSLTMNFYVSSQEKVFKFINHRNQPADIDTPEHFGFEGHERWGSTRGYIWSRSLPLIKDTLLIGHGPDTYALYFPQNEFNAKFKYLDSPYVLVDKPHNMYLQMAINTGVVSLVAFIFFVLWFIIGAIKLYIKPKAINTYYVAGVACVTAVVGYLVAGLANDSIIGVSTVFWILLGLGIACNRLYAKSILVPATTNVQPNKKIKK